MADVTEYEKERDNRAKTGEKKPKSNYPDVSDEELASWIALGHNYVFVGRIGQFCPIKPGCGGGELVVKRDDKYVSAAGAKGYRWLESEMVRDLGKEDDIDRGYYDRLVDDAIETISAYGDFYQFVSEDGEDTTPWFNPDEPWCDERTQFDVR